MNFLTATYFLLLFMKIQGRQPKIKLLNSVATKNANKILIEKQLASLSTNITPKIMNPANSTTQSK